MYNQSKWVKSLCCVGFHVLACSGYMSVKGRRLLLSLQRGLFLYVAVSLSSSNNKRRVEIIKNTVTVNSYFLVTAPPLQLSMETRTWTMSNNLIYWQLNGRFLVVGSRVKLLYRLFTTSVIPYGNLANTCLLSLCRFLVSVEFGRAVWLRFYPPAFPPCPNPSFVAHLGGVVVGLTLGVVVLQNYEQRLQEQSLFWIFFSVYALFVLCAVFWNIFAYGLLDVRLPPTPWPARRRPPTDRIPFILDHRAGWGSSASWRGRRTAALVLHPPLWRREAPDKQQPFSSHLSPPIRPLLWLSRAVVSAHSAARPSLALCLLLCCTFVSSVSVCGTFLANTTTDEKPQVELNRNRLEQRGQHSLTFSASPSPIQRCLLMEMSGW